MLFYCCITMILLPWQKLFSICSLCCIVTQVHLSFVKFTFFTDFINVPTYLPGTYILLCRTTAHSPNFCVGLHLTPGICKVKLNKQQVGVVVIV